MKSTYKKQTENIFMIDFLLCWIWYAYLDLECERDLDRVFDLDRDRDLDRDLDRDDVQDRERVRDREYDL